MIALAVPAQEQHLVGGVGLSISVQCPDLVLKALPLRLVALRVELGVRVVGPRDQAEIGGDLVCSVSFAVFVYE